MLLRLAHWFRGRQAGRCSGSLSFTHPSLVSSCPSTSHHYIWWLSIAKYRPSCGDGATIERHMCGDDVVELRLAIWGDETDGKFLGGISILGSSNMAYGNTDYSSSAYPFANTENLPVVVSLTRGPLALGKEEERYSAAYQINCHFRHYSIALYPSHDVP